MRWRIPKYYRGWFVSGGGGSGGAATVQTDGVTIQGDGSAGNKIAIKAVQTDASLTGAGTVASPLKQTAVTRYCLGNNEQNVSIVANQVQVFGVYLPVPLTFSNLTINFNNVDITHHFDWGVYSAAGVLLADVGPIILPAGSAFVTKPTVQGSVTLLPGVYLTALTGDASATNQFTISNDFPFTPWFVNTNYTSSSGGQLPTPITAPTPAFVRAGFAPLMVS